MIVLAGAEPPLTPDSPEAREWLERELAKPPYQDQQGLLDRLTGWLQSLFDRGPGGAVPGPVLWGVLLLVLVGIAVVIVRSLRPDATGAGGAGDVFSGARERTADEHRREARSALAAGDHDRAVLEAFRGLARDGVERTLVPESPGLTVHEVVEGLALAFPAKGAALAASAAAFDDVRYGERSADARTAGATVALGEELTSERPRLPDVTHLSAGAER